VSNQPGLDMRFVALIVYRAMRRRLKLAGSDPAQEAVLDRLRRIQRQSVSINVGAAVTGGVHRP
jgi:hypothetical protein